jgi:hypothetical protein
MSPFFAPAKDLLRVNTQKGCLLCFTSISWHTVVSRKWLTSTPIHDKGPSIKVTLLVNLVLPSEYLPGISLK